MEVNHSPPEKIRAVDIGPFNQWYQLFDDVENLLLDLNLEENCERSAKGAAKSTILRPTWAAWASLHNKALCKPALAVGTSFIREAYTGSGQR
jgi:GDP-D-mannose 3', 5'-epimerase